MLGNSYLDTRDSSSHHCDDLGHGSHHNSRHNNRNCGSSGEDSSRICGDVYNGVYSAYVGDSVCVYVCNGDRSDGHAGQC